MAVTEIGVLMIPVDARIAFDLDRFGITRTVMVGGEAPVEDLVTARVKGAAVTVFASPRRRWADVMAAIRAAVLVVGGGVSLRFYAPDCLIDIRSKVFDGEAVYGICPLLDPREAIAAEDVKAVVRLKRAVRGGLADHIGAEMRALAQRIRDTDAKLQVHFAGRAA